MTTTTTAVAAVAAKLVKGGTAQILLSTSNFTFSLLPSYGRSRQAIPLAKTPIIPMSSSFSPTLYNHNHLLHCFCTSTNANANAFASPSSASEPEPEPEPAAQNAEDNNSSDTSSTESTLKDAGNLLDIRVGRIIKAWRHEEADTLYVEEVDVGDPEPRIICSGLVKYIPLHHLQERNVVVLANLKPRNMRGVKSSGMLMAASDASRENVELLQPPEGSNPGDRIWFGSPDDQSSLPDPASPNQIQKKKIWESVQPRLKTDDSCLAMLGGVHIMRTSAGVVACDSLKNANIS